MLTIQLTHEEYLRLVRPINMPREKWGGFQQLIYALQRGIKSDTLELRLDRDHARRVLSYSDPKYGSGTYQSILRQIEPKVRKALDLAPAVETGSLFGEELANVV